MKYFHRFVEKTVSTDLARLTLVQHGAHVVLCDIYTLSEEPLPPDLKKIFFLTRAGTEKEKKAVEFVLENFWQRTDEGWIEEAISERIQAYKRRCKNTKEAALRREQRRREEQDAHDSSTTRAPKRKENKKKENKTAPLGRRTEGARPAAEDLQNGLETYITAMRRHHGVNPTITDSINTKIENLLRIYDPADARSIIQARVRTEGNL